MRSAAEHGSVLAMIFVSPARSSFIVTNGTTNAPQRQTAIDIDAATDALRASIAKSSGTKIIIPYRSM